MEGDETTPARDGNRGAEAAEPASAPAVVLRLMGVCLVLILLAWNVVRLWSATAAVTMSVMAALLPAIAVIVANSRQPVA